MKAQGTSNPLPEGLPAHEISGEVWSQLVRASLDRHHEWRTPVLASTGLDGVAQARTVVLRRVDRAAGNLLFYTDRRSPKVHELRMVPAAALVFWSRRLSWQLRVQVRIEIWEDGPEVASAWATVVQSPAAADYLSVTAPGEILSEISTITGVPEPLPSSTTDRLAQTFGLQRSELQGQGTTAGSATDHHLAIICATVQSIDWLELSRAGHRRALLSEGAVQWLVP